jgi:DNA polymerase (family 10)
MQHGVSPVAVLNAEIAEILNRTAELLEIEGANPFRVRAYRNAARTVGGLPRGVTAMLTEGTDLSALPGIGKDLAHKIEEVAETGHLPLLDEIEQRLPPGLARLLGVPGLGPKRVRALHEVLGVDDLDLSLPQIRSARDSGRLRFLFVWLYRLWLSVLGRHCHIKRMPISPPLVRHKLNYVSAGVHGCCRSG